MHSSGRALCQWGFRYAHNTGDNSIKLIVQYRKIVFSQVYNLCFVKSIV